MISLCLNSIYYGVFISDILLNGPAIDFTNVQVNSYY
jgi:hypothetical protein